MHMTIVSFPDPDLVPLTISQAWIDEVNALIPEVARIKTKTICFGI